MSNTRVLPIVSGSPNVAFDGTSIFTLTMPAAGFRPQEGDEVCLKSLALYYSWRNVTAAKGNNVIRYIWPDGNITKTVTLPDGSYSFDEIIAFVQLAMFTNGHYLLDSTGAPVYYLTWASNSVYYCLSLTATPLPATLPTGWSNPASVNLTTAAGKCPQLVVPAGTSTLTGFTAGTYPAAAQTTVYQVNSGVPQITDMTSFNIISNLANNQGLGWNPQVLTSFYLPNGQQPGSLIELVPYNLDWVPVSQTYGFQTITLQIVDQLFRPVPLIDGSGMVAILNIRKNARPSRSN